MCLSPGNGVFGCVDELTYSLGERRRLFVTSVCRREASRTQPTHHLSDLPGQFLRHARIRDSSLGRLR